MIARARHVAGDRIDRLDLAGEALRRARIEQAPVGALHALGDFACVEPHVAVRPRHEVAGAARGTSVVVGNPAAVHALNPPSSTATASCPTQRSSHHKRAAYAALSAS